MKKAYKINYIFKKLSVPDSVTNREKPCILHIGDIPLSGYPYIKRLLRKVQPEILVHTGDLLDNRKVGRIPGDVKAYKKQVPILVRVMRKYAGKVYWVPGNNDLPDYMKELAPDFIFTKPDSAVEIENIKFNLCHRVLDITKEADIYLYGHGVTGDTHKWEDNGKDGKYFCNATYGAHVIFTDTQTCIRL